MYFYLKGVIALHQKGAIVIDVNGVGYMVLVSHPEDYPIGTQQLVYTVFYVRENEQFLVGFKSFEEKQLFSRLVSVKGVGPKTAMNALGSSSVDKLVEAIRSSNLLYLTSLDGVGPKAASQIILDLRGKLTLNTEKTGEKELDEAIEGLSSFGFTRREILDAVSKIPGRGLKAEEYISQALRLLNGNRK